MNPKYKNPDNLTSLEKQLATTLQPVKPSMGFVQTTRRKFNFASPTVVAQRLADSNFVLMLLAGLMGAVLVILTSVRILFYLSGRNKLSKPGVSIK